MRKPDRRVERTRQELLTAFYGLVLERGYDRIKVGDIIERAEIGRSTFYEHFECKDDLLKQSLSGLFAVLADTISPGHDIEKMRVVLAHFWENRRQATVIFAGATHRILSGFLSDLIELRLATLIRDTPGAKPLVSPRLVASSLAESQLTFVTAWLSGKASCTARALAQALHASTHASTSALLKRQP